MGLDATEGPDVTGPDDAEELREVGALARGAATEQREIVKEMRATLRTLEAQKRDTHDPAC